MISYSRQLVTIFSLNYKQCSFEWFSWLQRRSIYPTN